MVYLTDREKTRGFRIKRAIARLSSCSWYDTEIRASHVVLLSGAFTLSKKELNQFLKEEK